MNHGLNAEKDVTLHQAKDHKISEVYIGSDLLINPLYVGKLGSTEEKEISVISRQESPISTSNNGKT